MAEFTWPADEDAAWPRFEGRYCAGPTFSADHDNHPAHQSELSSNACSAAPRSSDEHFEDKCELEDRLTIPSS